MKPYNPRQILSSKDVQAVTGYSRVTLWRKARNLDDPFPPPISLGANKIGWFQDEIIIWQEGLSRVDWSPGQKASS